MMSHTTKEFLKVIEKQKARINELESQLACALETLERVDEHVQYELRYQADCMIESCDLIDRALSKLQASRNSPSNPKEINIAERWRQPNE